MSFLLCHDCYTWVEPKDDRCPECLLGIDASERDPSPRVLSEVMGHLIDRVGEVRIPRPMLPEWGTLYTTDNGLFFVPHEMDHTVAITDGGGAGSSVLWTLGSLLWSPLFFLMPFLSGGGRSETTVKMLRPQFLLEGQSPTLAEALMDNPGAFFLPRQQIREMSCKRSRWIIERQAGRRLTLLPITPANAFGEKMQALSQSSRW